MDNIIKFYSKSKDNELRKLSNFNMEKIIVEDIEFKSGEHCFQYFKYLSSSINCKNDDIERSNKLLEHSNKILESENANEAKKLGSKSSMKLNNKEIYLWNKLCYDYQHKICLAKLEQNKNLKNILLNTNNKYLLHQDNRAKEKTIWGGRIKYDILIGKNELGKIWMSLRNKFNFE